LLLYGKGSIKGGSERTCWTEVLQADNQTSFACCIPLSTHSFASVVGARWPPSLGSY